MGKFREAVLGAAISTGAVLGTTSTDVFAHEAQVNVVDVCAGEGNEVAVNLTGFQGHNLLNNVVYIDIMSGDGKSKGGPAVSDTVDEAALFSDGTESLSYDLLPGNYLASIAWVVDYDNDGLVGAGESFNTKDAFFIDACEEPTTTTSSTTTVPTTSIVPTTVPPETTAGPTTSAPETPTSSSTPSSAPTTSIVESKTPVDSTLPPTGISEKSANQQLRIAGIVAAAGAVMLGLARRRTRA